MQHRQPVEISALRTQEPYGASGKIELPPERLPRPTGGKEINPIGFGELLRLLFPNPGPLMQQSEVFLARGCGDSDGLREQPDSLQRIVG
jgi:hypothetical protein